MRQFIDIVSKSFLEEAVGDNLISEARVQPASASVPNEIYRWVDDGGARSYIRSDAMIGRVRHCLPPQLSGFVRTRWQTGLSFALKANGWGAMGTVCFVIDPEKIGNDIVLMNGHSVYNFGQSMQAFSPDCEQWRRLAIEDSLNDPDEAFVIGGIRNLHASLTGILVKQPAPKLLTAVMAYADSYGVEVRSYPSGGAEPSFSDQNQRISAPTGRP